MLAYCEGEAGAREVAGFLKKALRNRVQLHLCVVNWGEMYYIALREGGMERAELYRTTIAKYPITLVPADTYLALQAAILKGSYKISFADAFAAALAKKNGAVLITGDPEFKPMVKEIKIHWVG